ncbi:MAG TPA: fibronectin type III domain-containing protein [Candidatus Acidoferrales bacterium]|nr:fibronectin type III domain-containing protein [Candidatus Acidoferrales bacterium]
MKIMKKSLNYSRILLVVTSFAILVSLAFVYLHQYQVFAQTTTTPDPPIGFTATAVSSTSISLNWSPPQNNGGSPIIGYEIDYRVAPSTTYSTLVTLNNVATYTHINLITGKTYIYRVSAINTIGTGSPTPEVLATPTSTNNALTTSVNESKVKAIAVSTSSIAVSFNEPENIRNSSISFKIDKSDDGGSTWLTIIDSQDGSGVSYYDKDLFPNTTYTYRVFLISASGESTMYATTSATTLVPTIESGWVKTDKSVYVFGDKITISGKVFLLPKFSNLSISVSRENDQGFGAGRGMSNNINVKPDGTFTIQLQTNPNETWSRNGVEDGEFGDGKYDVCLLGNVGTPCLYQTSFTLNYNQSPPPKITIEPSYSHSYVNFTATVTDTSNSPITPTGSISWNDGTNIPCTLASAGNCPTHTERFEGSPCILSSGSCSVSYTPDEYSSNLIQINAYYDGDTIHRSNIGFFTLNVTNLRNVPPSPLEPQKIPTPPITPSIPIDEIGSGFIAYDSGKGEIFVANQGCSGCIGSVSVISDSSNTVIATIPIEAEPIAIAYDSAKGEVFVTTYAITGVTVYVISDATNTVITTIPAGPAAIPWCIAYDTGKGEIFMTLVGSSATVSIISDSTNTVVAAIPIGPSQIVSGITYDSGKGEVFVSGNGGISVISDATNTVITTIPMGAGGIAYDSAKGEIFVESTNGISIISDSTNAVVGTVSGGRVGAYDSAKGEIFGYDGSAVSIISDSTNQVITTIPIYSPMDVFVKAPGIAYDSAKGEVFVTVPNGISVISDATNQVINPQTNTAVIPPTNTPIVQPTNPPFTSLFTPTPQDIQKINQAKASQTIAAEVNVGASQSTTTSIDNNVSVQTTINNPDSLGVTVTAPSQTGPKVIMFNLNATTINVANLKDLGVMYDGKLIQPAPNMDAILHAKSTDNPSFAIIVTQSGVQVLVLVPHFSTHSITIMNMSKIMAPTVPEFPFAAIVLIIATFSIVLIPKIR